VTAPADFIHEIRNCSAKMRAGGSSLQAHCFSFARAEIRLQNQSRLIVNNNEFAEPGNFACKVSDGAQRMTPNNNEHQCKNRWPGSWAEQVCLLARPNLESRRAHQATPGVVSRLAQSAQFRSFNLPNALI
jgi:hypothetical protein